MTKISGQFQDNFEISGISGQLGALSSSLIGVLNLAGLHLIKETHDLATTSLTQLLNPPSIVLDYTVSQKSRPPNHQQ